MQWGSLGPVRVEECNLHEVWSHTHHIYPGGPHCISVTGEITARDFVSNYYNCFAHILIIEQICVNECLTLFSRESDSSQATTDVDILKKMRI